MLVKLTVVLIFSEKSGRCSQVVVIGKVKIKIINWKAEYFLLEM